MGTKMAILSPFKRVFEVVLFYIRVCQCVNGKKNKVFV